MKALALLLITLITTPALAVDLGKPFTDLEGKPVCGVEVKDGAECPADKLFTLRIAARNALYAQYPDEKDLSGDEKFKRAELAQGLTGAGDVKLKPEEIALIKRLIAKSYPPLVVYQSWKALDDAVR